MARDRTTNDVADQLKWVMRASSLVLYSVTTLVPFRAGHKVVCYALIATARKIQIMRVHRNFGATLKTSEQAMAQPTFGSNNPPEINPYQYTPDQKTAEMQETKPGSLGSLAQASRGQQLNSARTTLIVIGVLSLIVNLVLMAMIPGQLRDELQKNGQALNPEQMAIATNVAMAIQGMFAFLGLVFILCGVLVKRFPIACTVTALVLYILSALVTAAFDPTTLARGLIIKIVIVVALFKAVQAAFAYQKEMQGAAV